MDKESNLFIPFIKASKGFSFQEKRREMLFEHQKKDRDNILEQARKLMMECKSDSQMVVSAKEGANDHENNVIEVNVEGDMVDEALESLTNKVNEMDLEKSTQSTSKQTITTKQKKQMNYYSRQLTIPEWMITVPNNLSEDYWIVIAKPDGMRCLLTASGGKTIARDKNGLIFSVFYSWLSGGCPENNPDKCTILDCIFDSANGTFYIMDVLVWKDIAHLYSPTALRFYWIEEHIIPELMLSPDSTYKAFSFIDPRRYSCNTAGLKAAYYEKTSYLKDGLLFYQKEAHYIQGLNPYILAWKDSTTSLYPIETDDGVIDDKVKAVLQMSKEGELKTLEGIVMGEVEKSEKEGKKWFPGNLIRVSLEEVKINEMADEIKDGFQVKKLRVLKRSSRIRANCDSITKIIYQYMMRNSPIKISDLIGTVASNENEGIVVGC